MQLKKRQITARIPEELYEKCNAKYDNMTDAVIAGLEMLCNAECNASNANCNAEEVKCNANEINCNADVNNCNANCNADIISISEQAEIKELKARVEEKDKHIETLKGELNKAERDKEGIRDQLKSNDDNQILRITDLKEEISVLRNELTNKNDTIKNLTTITESQIKGYKLIEAPGAKKSFLSRLKFW